MVGKKYPMRVEVTQSIKTDVPNQSQPEVQEVKINQGFDISAVKELENGGRQLEMRFENEKIDVLQGSQSVLNFDSTQSTAEDANNPAAPVLRAALGSPIQYFTDANGKVERMEGVDELTRRVAAAESPQTHGHFREMFSETTLRRYGSFADIMPNRVVKTGESWNYKGDVPTSVGVMTVDMKYTFKDWQEHDGHPCAHVTGKGECSTKSASAATGVLVEVKKGKITGEFWYDPALGMIIGSSDDQDLTLKITTRQQTMSSQFNQNVQVALVDTP